jgi:uncharacterized protein YdhG (YjbR/CyaY superfamily)
LHPDQKSQAVQVKTPKPGVIDLKDAEVVGQKVHGTSNGSIYICVAVSQNLKVACRLESTNLSVRVEWKTPLSDMELTRLKVNSLSVKKDYASVHLDTSGVPVERVLGAVLFGLGLKFDQQVQSFAEFTGK